MAEQREALQHVGHVVDRTAAHLLGVVLEAALPILLAVDLAVAEDPEEAIDLGVADGPAQAHAVGIPDRHEHRRLVGSDAEGIEPAGGAEDGFFFDTFDDAETVIRVNDLVTDLECHVSPVLGRVSSGGWISTGNSIQNLARNLKRTGHNLMLFRFLLRTLRPQTPSPGNPRLQAVLLCVQRLRVGSRGDRAAAGGHGRARQLLYIRPPPPQSVVARNRWQHYHRPDRSDSPPPRGNYRRPVKSMRCSDASSAAGILITARSYVISPLISPSTSVVCV